MDGMMLSNHFKTKGNNMKTLIATTAILLATTFAANADVNDDLAAAQAEIANLTAQLVTANIQVQDANNSNSSYQLQTWIT